MRITAGGSWSFLRLGSWIDTPGGPKEEELDSRLQRNPGLNIIHATFTVGIRGSFLAQTRHHLSDLKDHYASYRRYLKEYGRKEVYTPVIREVYCAETMQQAQDEGGPGMIYIQAGMCTDGGHSCSPSAQVRQNGVIEEERVFGSC